MQPSPHRAPQRIQRRITRPPIRPNTHTTRIALSFPQILIFIRQPFLQHIRRITLPVLSREHLGCDTMFICSVCMGAVQEECADDTGMAVGSCKVEGGGTGRTNDWSGGVMVFVGVAPG